MITTSKDEASGDITIKNGADMKAGIIRHDRFRPSGAALSAADLIDIASIMKGLKK